MGAQPLDNRTKAEFSYSLTQNGLEWQVAEATDLSASAPVPGPDVAYAANNPVANVNGNYNGLFVPVSTGSVNYLVAASSIVLASLSGALTELSAANPAFVLDKKPGLPASYSGKLAGTSGTGTAFG